MTYYVHCAIYTHSRELTITIMQFMQFNNTYSTHQQKVSIERKRKKLRKIFLKYSPEKNLMINEIESFGCIKKAGKYR